MFVGQSSSTYGRGTEVARPTEEGRSLQLEKDGADWEVDEEKGYEELDRQGDFLYPLVSEESEWSGSVFITKKFFPFLNVNNWTSFIISGLDVSDKNEKLPLSAWTIKLARTGNWT